MNNPNSKGRNYDGYKGRNLDFDRCVASLKRKKVEVKKIANGMTIVDIEHAIPASLGNKSWGMISFLCNGNIRGAVTGRRKYSENTSKNLGLDKEEVKTANSYQLDRAVKKITQAFSGELL